MSFAELVVRLHAWYSEFNPAKPTYLADQDPEAYQALQGLTPREREELFVLPVQMAEFGRTGLTIPGERPHLDFRGGAIHG